MEGERERERERERDRERERKRAREREVDVDKRLKGIAVWLHEMQRNIKCRTGLRQNKLCGY